MAELWLPELYLGLGGINNAAPSITNFTFDATNDALEFILQMPEGATITHAGYRQGTLTGTAPVFKISLQGVDGSGNPDGTILGGGSPASATFTPTAGNNNSWQWVALDNAIAVSRGQLVAVVIAHNSGTIDASNNCSFTATHRAGWSSGRPYAIQNNAGTRTKQGDTPCCGVKSASRSYGFPLSAIITASYGSASNPDEKAIKFQLPAGSANQYCLIGARIWSQLTTAGAWDLKLYDSDGTTVLHDETIDSDQFAAPTSARNNLVFFDETTLAVLSPGVDYRLSLVPTTGSPILYGITVANAGDLSAWPLGGSAHMSTRTDAGAWTDDTLSRPGIWPLLAEATSAAGISLARAVG